MYINGRVKEKQINKYIFKLILIRCLNKKYVQKIK